MTGLKILVILHVPTPDFTAPDMDRIDSAVDFIHEQINNDQSVMVHCAAGMGRAGTILACYFVKYQKLFSTRMQLKKFETKDQVLFNLKYKN